MIDYDRLPPLTSLVSYVSNVPVPPNLNLLVRRREVRYNNILMLHGIGTTFLHMFTFSLEMRDESDLIHLSISISKDRRWIIDGR